MNTLTTSDTILQCARQLIVEGGYGAFSYADIAKVVGIRKASIHHHFPTKADLVRTLVRGYREEAATGLAALDRACPDAGERLAAYLEYWRACIGDGSHPFCVCALLAAQIPVLPEEIVAEIRAHFDTLAAWLGRVLNLGVEQGGLRLAAPARSEAEVFIATVHGAMLSARAHDNAGLFQLITEPLIARLTVRH